ncbi:zinc ribbon domain-containing protein [bacterium]|nr:zinc ribbon domain-containing protein [bacterium]MBU1638730.1 zinc ribbon domain-containing protein [bacterium]RQV98607.1 MAG: zinc ribbon domain-containing protein [bacterium]
MPTYDYRCENGHTFEEFQSMVDPPLEICPVCGGKAERLISGGSGLIFKGSGFYITDYARKSGGSSSGIKESKTPTVSGDVKSASTKTESKSD